MYLKNIYSTANMTEKLNLCEWIALKNSRGNFYTLVSRKSSSKVVSFFGVKEEVQILDGV